MIRSIQAQRGPICGVFAATLTTPDVPFVMVKTMAGEEMAKRRWTGPMHIPALKGVLGQLKVEYTESSALTGKTLKDAAEELDPTKHYIVMVTGHFLTLRNRLAYDQAHPHGKPIEEFWCLNRKVISFLEITKLGATYDELFPDED